MITNEKNIYKNIYIKYNCQQKIKFNISVKLAISFNWQQYIAFWQNNE